MPILWLLLLLNLHSVVSYQYNFSVVVNKQYTGNIYDKAVVSDPEGRFYTAITLSSSGNVSWVINSYDTNYKPLNSTSVFSTPSYASVYSMTVIDQWIYAVGEFNSVGAIAVFQRPNLTLQSTYTENPMYNVSKWTEVAYADGTMFIVGTALSGYSVVAAFNVSGGQVAANLWRTYIANTEAQDITVNTATKMIFTTGYAGGANTFIAVLNYSGSVVQYQLLNGSSGGTFQQVKGLIQLNASLVCFTFSNFTYSLTNYTAFLQCKSQSTLQDVVKAFVVKGQLSDLTATADGIAVCGQLDNSQKFCGFLDNSFKLNATNLTNLEIPEFITTNDNRTIVVLGSFYSGTNQIDNMTLYQGIPPPLPSPSPSPSASRSPSSLPSTSNSPTPSPSSVPSASATPSVSSSPSSVPSASASPNPPPSASPSPSTSPMVVPSPSPSLSSSAVPSSASALPSPSPTASPVSPSSSPSSSSSPGQALESPSPSSSPIVQPSASASPDEGTSSSGSPRANNLVGALVGIVAAVGGLLLVTVAAVTVFLVRRKSKKRSDIHEMAAIESHPDNSDTPRKSDSITQYGTGYAKSGPSISIYKGSSAGSYVATESYSRSALITDQTRIAILEHKNWIIEYSEIKMEDKIGAGAYGEVYKGKWRGVDVAVKKTLLAEGQEEAFFSEFAVMQKMRPHTNITQLFGVCIEPLCIVTEFIANGSLINWLQHHTLHNDAKVNIARGIAAGMLHLHGEGIIHRDLAARNILLDKNLCPKVADFGMSRTGSKDSSFQTRNTVGPIRWMAPEALAERTYNTKTDVWSYGVTLFEIMTHKMPYERLDLTQTCGAVITGSVSLYQDIEDRERECPIVLVTLMKLCMEREPSPFMEHNRGR